MVYSQWDGSVRHDWATNIYTHILLKFQVPCLSQVVSVVHCPYLHTLKWIEQVYGLDKLESDSFKTEIKTKSTSGSRSQVRTELGHCRSLSMECACNLLSVFPASALFSLAGGACEPSSVLYRELGYFFSSPDDPDLLYRQYAALYVVQIV